MEFKKAIRKLGSVNTDAAGNYSGLKKGLQGRLLTAQRKVIGRGVLSPLTCLNHGLMNLGKDLRKEIDLLESACKLMIKIRSFFALSGKRVSNFEV